MSEIRNVGLEQGFGTQTSSAGLESRIPGRLAPPEWQTVTLPTPKGEVGSLPLLRFLEGCTQQPSPCPPAQCLLIKGSSSRKMGGSLLRKMNQQPQGEKEEDLWGHWTFF